MACWQKLAFIERSIAALWVVGREFVTELDTEILRIRHQLQGVSTRAQSLARVVPLTEEEELQWLTEQYGTRNDRTRCECIPPACGSSCNCDFSSRTTVLQRLL